MKRGKAEGLKGQGREAGEARGEKLEARVQSDGTETVKGAEVRSTTSEAEAATKVQDEAEAKRAQDAAEAKAKAEAEAKARAEAEAQAKAEAEAKAQAEAEEKARIEAAAKAKLPCEFCGLTGEHKLGCPAVTKVECVKSGCAGCSFAKGCRHFA